MDSPAIGALTERLERLERSNRRWRRLVAGLLMAGASAAIVGARQAEKPGVVEAERFVLKGRDGKTRATLREMPDGRAVLAFFDRQGANRLLVGTNVHNEPVVGLLGHDGQDRLVLVLDPEGIAKLNLRDDGARPRIVLGVRPGGEAVQTFFGHDGHGQLELAISRDGAPQVKIQSPGGRTLFKAP